MAIFDKIGATVLTTFKADTKPMRAELKKLSGEELKRHKALLDQTEEQNAKLDSHIATWGKVAIGVGAAVAAYKVLSASVETYQHNSKLAAATVGVGLSGLQKATNGLVEETRLLEFASSAMNGTFKLSQGEMELALRGAMALRKGGEDLTKVMANIEKAVKEGTTEPLKELGIVVKGVENDTREGLMAALDELQEQARLAGPDLSIPGDAMAAASVKMADATDALKSSLGELAIALIPLVEKLAEMVRYVASLRDTAAEIVDKKDNKGAGKNRLLNNWKEFGLSVPRALGIVSDPNDPEDLWLNLPGATPSVDSGRSSPFDFRFREDRGFDASAPLSDVGGGTGVYFDPNIQGRKKGKGKAKSRDLLDMFRSNNGDLGDGIDITGALGSLMGRGADFAGGFKDTSDAERARLKYISDVERISALEAELSKHAMEDSLMSQVFGTPSEINQQAVELQLLTDTFSSLTGAFGAGIDALITGSSSFADAFKSAIGESLRAMAVEMSISALKHTAYGLASLAFMDGRGASAHFAAAGTFAAGALAAGGGARLLGAGQAPTAAPRTAGSAGVGSSAGSGSGEGKGSTVINLIGNDFAGLPARQRESQYRQIMRGAGMSLEGDVIFDG